MTDRFSEKAAGWDEAPIPTQIARGVGAALATATTLHPSLTVMDFGAGTGLVAGQLAAAVGHVVAVDVSPAMLAKLAEKPELAGKVTTVCQDLLTAPLAERFDLIVSAMAMHHVEDTARLAEAFFQHLVPGGAVALADLDAEDGTFHPPATEGVFHAGFSREALGALLVSAGFVDVRFTTACTVTRDGKDYPIFLVTAARPAP